MISAYEMSLHLSCYKLSLISVFHSSMKNNFYAIFSCYHESLIFPSNKIDITNYNPSMIFKNNFVFIKIMLNYFDLHCTAILFLIMDENLLLSVFVGIACLPNA